MCCTATETRVCEGLREHKGTNQQSEDLIGWPMKGFSPHAQGRENVILPPFTPHCSGGAGRFPATAPPSPPEVPGFRLCSVGLTDVLTTDKASFYMGMWLSWDSNIGSWLLQDQQGKGRRWWNKKAHRHFKKVLPTCTWEKKSPTQRERGCGEGIGGRRVERQSKRADIRLAMAVHLLDEAGWDKLKENIQMTSDFSVGDKR